MTRYVIEEFNKKLRLFIDDNGVPFEELANYVKHRKDLNDLEKARYQRYVKNADYWTIVNARLNELRQADKLVFEYNDNSDEKLEIYRLRNGKFQIHLDQNYEVTDEELGTVKYYNQSAVRLTSDQAEKLAQFLMHDKT